MDGLGQPDPSYIHIVQELLGHPDLATIMIYAHA